MLTPSTPHPLRDRRNLGLFRISKSIKSTLYATLKWGINEGSLAGCFYFKVPNTPEQRELITALKKRKAPMGNYNFSDSLQWCLSKREYRAIWLANSPKLED